MRHLPLIGLVALALFVGVTLAGGGSIPVQRPAEALEQARQRLVATDGVRFSLHTDDLPDDVVAIEGASGTLTHAPAFAGTITAPVKGLRVQIAVRATGGKVYAKFPFVADYARIDPSEYGVPDPASLLDRDTGLPSLLSRGSDLRRGRSVRGGPGNRDVVTEYTATLPGDAVAGVIPGSEGDFSATYRIDDHGALSRAVLTGHFNGLDSPPNTYTLSIEEYDVSPTIEPPAGATP